MIKEHSVEYVDFRFTDPRGKWQHTAQHVSTIDEDAFRDGIMFDGSSIAGWKAINESDMILMPDAETAVHGPVRAKPQLILFCDIIEPSTGQIYRRDPRTTAKRAEAYLKSHRHRRHASLVGAEAEFFVFDSVRFGTGGNFGHLPVESVEGPGSNLKEYPEGNMGHRPGVKGGYFPVAAGRRRQRPARRDALDHGRDGPVDREAPPRGGAVASTSSAPSSAR